jgi:exopolysaccharide biosynthesis polyprenyl glycosylphosphotransferase
MFKQQVFIINLVLMTLDALCLIAAGYGAHYLRSYESYRLWSMEEHSFGLSVLIVMFVNNYAMGRVGLYTDRKITSYWKLTESIFIAVIADFAILAIALFLIQQEDYSKKFLTYFASLALCLLILERFTANAYLNHVGHKNISARRLLVIGDQKRAKIVVDALDHQLSMGHDVVDCLSFEENGQLTAKRLKDLPSLLKEKEIDEVVLAIPRDKSLDLKSYLDICARMGIPARILPGLWDPVKRPLDVERCQGVPFLTMNVNGFNVTGLIYKRILDVLGGLVGSFIFLAFYPFVALAIKLDSPGPVLFKQDRVGRNGRIFKLYKFRSMYVDAKERQKELAELNEMQGPMFKLKDDPRITRVGKFLRRTSLDELPQFINVLRNEMSLVGTRPPTREEVEEYKVWHYKRISAKPGITGLWQINGRNKVTEFAEVVRLDCRYLEKWRFRDDIKILFKTIWVVLARKGAF